MKITPSSVRQYIREMLLETHPGYRIVETAEDAKGYGNYSVYELHQLCAAGATRDGGREFSNYMTKPNRLFFLEGRHAKLPQCRGLAGGES